MLGAGLQTARRLMAEGVIGMPQTALTMMQSPGPELWHPDPEFLFQPGAGPVFDIGPYYLSWLATIFGPAERVAAVGRRSRDTRVIAKGPRAGTEFRVEVPTHYSALIEYADGPAATLLFSFESPLPRHGFMEVTGTEATMVLPDPNRFDGEIKIRAIGADDWEVRPVAGAIGRARARRARHGPGAAPRRPAARAGRAGPARARDHGGRSTGPPRTIRSSRCGRASACPSRWTRPGTRRPTL